MKTSIKQHKISQKDKDIFFEALLHPKEPSAKLIEAAKQYKAFKLIKQMKEFNLDGHEFIELNKLLKLLKMVQSGGEANARIENGEVIVNGNVEKRKRNKLRAGDTISFQENTVVITST